MKTQEELADERGFAAFSIWCREPDIRAIWGRLSADMKRVWIETAQAVMSVVE